MITTNTGKVLALLSLAIGVSLIGVGCSGGGNNSNGPAAKSAGSEPESSGAGAGDLAGDVKIDGSSTVYPVSEAVAEEFRAVQPKVRVTVGFSGTGGGMKKFIAGEVDICDASRAMKEKEATACKEQGIEYIELSVAFDGLAVIVNPENSWCDCLTVGQLKELWRPESGVKQWKDLDPKWPAEDIKLYGPGTDSGTFDYFTEAIVGESKASRADYTASEDDNVLVTGVSEDKNSLGYFGFAYYEENKDKLKLLGVDGGEGCKKPSLETVRNNSYAPLSRPLFIYVRKSALERPEVVAFVKFYLENAAALSKDVGYVPVSDEVQKANMEAFNGATSK
ncbi:PstS family phosphate ABC transporter substrate-binding protein [Gimesia sp.]|uniref:PstS family phosphate ABC transporter substrate-binding protein n=1 Tax=Gimesia sp. TaxID=2024833 RepID=UPI000C3884F7|nr:PstS family phosphate ABC transporter substrate-binding protein [Gimesia sp.]MAX38835.1 phosphate-binding protein [Gimesia sp.]HAH47772.1 phosphate-binding protein [Planctomycetaceae bacterium]HBL43516.1 phosphate-binding protein [Planctomycetaceae bacterium]